MESRMLPLVQIQFNHGYFSSRLCTGLLPSAAGATNQTMTNHGLWWKATPGGFTLFYDARHAGNHYTRDAVLEGHIALRFVLRLQDPYFYNYTASPAALPGRQVLYFYNRKGSPLLHADPQVSAADLVGLAPSGRAGGKRIVLAATTGDPFAEPFAILHLRLRPGLEDGYRIEFQPRSTTWNYILAGRHLQELANPAVINTVTGVSFIGPTAVRLMDGRPALSFVSPAPIDCSERQAAACMLVEDFDPATGRHKVVIPTLPAPDARIISRAIATNAAAVATSPGTAAPAVAAASPPENYSDILIY